jgi:hypothetical protein
MAEDTLICMVEIPMGSRNKYEFDPRLGAIKFERHSEPIGWANRDTERREIAEAQDRFRAQGHTS